MKCVLQWQTRPSKNIPYQNGEDTTRSRFVKYFLVANKSLNDNVYQLLVNEYTEMTHDIVCVCSV